VPWRRFERDPALPVDAESLLYFNRLFAQQANHAFAYVAAWVHSATEREAVLAVGADDVRDAIARAEALTSVRGSDDFSAISAAFKRIKNILRQAEEKGFAIQAASGIVLSAQAQQLADAAAALVPVVAELRLKHAYGEALAAIATLRPTVDAFFDKALVLENWHDRLKSKLPL